jgi:UDP-N-acetylmuramoylalanine--D-glutamate ligase
VRPGFDFQGKRVLVVGLARTGLAVALFSAAYGATVTATDAKPEAEIAETAARLRHAGVTLELANPATDFFLNQDLIVVSPGVPANLPALQLARAHSWPSPARTARPRPLRSLLTF